MLELMIGTLEQGARYVHLGTGCRLGVHKTFRKPPGRLLRVFCAFIYFLLFAGMVYITSIPVSINSPFPLSDVIKTSHVVLVSLFLTLNFRLKGFLGFLLYINTSFEHVYVNWALLLQTADSNYTQLTLENSTCELFSWCWYKRRDFGI